MTRPASLSVIVPDLDAIATFVGRVAVIVPEDGTLDPAGRRVNKLTKGALKRFVESEAFTKLAFGEARDLLCPVGMEAQALQIVKLDRRGGDEHVARKAGASIGKGMSGTDVLVLAGTVKYGADLALGALLRAYAFTDHKSEGAKTEVPTVTLALTKPEEVSVDQVTALAEGVFFTRDLVSEPANILTTTEFGNRLEALRGIGLEVEVLEEDKLEALGMRTLLSVGFGSASPSKVVVMQWKGGDDEAPLALVGKGVVFDTGGISLKPAGGMEDMTMDMGGAGVVAGVMKSLALRKAKANVVGLVGIVENMPSDRATRPGDVVKSMKGDTVEIINTDAEGRLVLCDVMWYAQERFNPRAMIDLATLTGAIIVGLGHENAGVFSNDDPFCRAFLKAAEDEGEGAWRLPMGQAYDDQLKSAIADMKNVGTRAGGSITAAQFLKRFVKEGQPWIHLDIAGVASVKADTTLAPKGATGWGVLALNRLVDDLDATPTPKV
ncbi:putative cytosol aminopeptidase [Aquimixticola soesokkakensis]|uniref:Probable cytosol aminopeptidase n=1 Tax=Aquimixticola soesokkakensis TaxID=1519096 RepID=A0A1Y5TLP1_9RHOB|nr:leucyl aminopeptidase [Aquimixticola soesokkakensis]SLN64915.1 putative cytosol aminopeptidase [Aquimixticola soesokkakensis]